MKLVNLLLLLCGLASAADGQDLSRPNIILMMADDMGLGDTSVYQDFTGNTDQQQIHTPEMERLARMGVRLTDAHTPSSRCSPTRYGLLTGRYPWRNRLKFWVLFGAQGDPMIEADRPTIATLLRDQGYHTGMVGKWHVGLRDRQSDGRPAAGFDDADLQMPLADTSMDHGFDFSRFTSRSHGTSGPEPGKRNKPDQNVGPGHIDGRTVIAATADGRQLADTDPLAYRLHELGGRHSDNAMQFLHNHVTDESSRAAPFFLYYASNSNHTPHTADSHVGDRPVAGASRSVAGEPLDKRSDFIYENDAALGRLLDWLSTTTDPRHSGHKLIENTLVIFTSDNGAEKNSNTATGPFRSHKGSCYEGGHRVPFLAAWPAGRIGDGRDSTPGQTCSQLLGLTDVFATLADIVSADLPDHAKGHKGGEDSLSMLAVLRGTAPRNRPLFFNDHKEASDPAVAVLRMDNPALEGSSMAGQWKLFFDARLLRAGETHPIELYDLASDPQEQNNRVSEPELRTLVQLLSDVALQHRTAGGHRLATVAADQRVTFRWDKADPNQAPSLSSTLRVMQLADQFHNQPSAMQVVDAQQFQMTLSGVPQSGASAPAVFSVNPRGLGLNSGTFQQFDDGDALLVTFDRDVIVESVGLVAGNGVCGGFYRVGEGAPLAIYCVDADIDSRDQSGLLSDIGVVRAEQVLRLDSSPHFGVEAAGQWRLASLTIRLLR